MTIPFTPVVKAGTGGLAFTQIATQPQAAVGLAGYNGNTWSSSITAIAFEGNTLIPAYGDSNYNSDSWGGPDARTMIMPLDLATNQWLTGQQTYTGSESNDVFRTINGHLYTPTTDPSIHGTGGFATNRSGSWQAIFPTDLQPAIHVFDIASLDNTDQDLWVAGSTGNPAGGGFATIWHSTDGGSTWTIVRQEASTPADATGGFERYYGLVAFNGKMYVQAYGISPDIPMQVYDGATQTWSTQPSQFSCGFYYGMTLFDNTIVCGYNSSNVILFDGTSTRTVEVPSEIGGSSIVGKYIEGGYFYMVNQAGEIFRSSSWSTPATRLGQVSLPTGTTAASIGVHNDVVYVGDSHANIWKSTTTITDMIPYVPDPIIPALSGTDARFWYNNSQTILTVTGDRFEPNITATIDGISVPVNRTSATQLSLTVTPSQLPVLDASTPDVTTTISGAYTIYTKQCTLTVTNPDGSTASQSISGKRYISTPTAPQPPTPTTPPATPQPSIPPTPTATPASTAQSTRRSPRITSVTTVMPTPTTVGQEEATPMTPTSPSLSPEPTTRTTASAYSESVKTASQQPAWQKIVGIGLIAGSIATLGGVGLYYLRRR